MKIKNIVDILESVAPLSLQESYDNSGLIIGELEQVIDSAIICLDATEDVVREAIELQCKLIIAHHPIVFKGLKRFNNNDYVERVVSLAIKNDIAIYAIHTNLDNALHNGVNHKIADILGLSNIVTLAPKPQQVKKLTFVSNPIVSNEVRAQLQEIGAGIIYPNGPEHYISVGSYSLQGQNLPVVKVEMSFPADRLGQVLNYLQNRSDISYEISDISNVHPNIGAGLVGHLPAEMEMSAFLHFLKEKMEVSCLKYTKPHTDKVSKVALCGGSGSFLLGNAIRQKADIFISSDFKYHDFFDANDNITIADIGHYESEQFTMQLIFEIISNKLPNFAVHYTKCRTNPVFYL